MHVARWKNGQRTLPARPFRLFLQPCSYSLYIQKMGWGLPVAVIKPHIIESLGLRPLASRGGGTLRTLHTLGGGVRPP